MNRELPETKLEFFVTETMRHFCGAMTCATLMFVIGGTILGIDHAALFNLITAVGIPVALGFTVFSLFLTKQRWDLVEEEWRFFNE